LKAAGFPALVRLLSSATAEENTNYAEPPTDRLPINTGTNRCARHSSGLGINCKLNGVDPQTYFTDVLTKLVNLWPASRLDELMPWNLAADAAIRRAA